MADVPIEIPSGEMTVETDTENIEDDVPKRTVNVKMSELSEQDLGIYEDTADCADLTDTDNEDGCHDNKGNHDKSNYDNKINKGMEVIGENPEDELDEAFPVAPGDNAEADELVDKDELAALETFDEGGSAALMRRKMNTPASNYTHGSDWSELKEVEQQSRVGSQAKEAYYQQAMNLMSARCKSRHRRTPLSSSGSKMGQETPLISLKDPPVGSPVLAKYFYVNQRKPQPMKPLKAWRGYHGNVYFEPILVHQAQRAPKPDRQTPELENCSDQLRRILNSRNSRRSSHDKDDQSSDSKSTQGSVNAGLKSKHTQRGNLYQGTVSRQMAVLDKRAVLDRLNQQLLEDLTWIQGQENTGSLQVDEPVPASRAESAKHRKFTYNREKICKGSVAHKLYVQNVALNGERYTVASGSPRAYSQNHFRTPEVFHTITYRHDSNGESLPPLDQLRHTLRHMDKSVTDLDREITVPSLDRLRLQDAAKRSYRPYVRYN